VASVPPVGHPEPLSEPDVGRARQSPSYLKYGATTPPPNSPVHATALRLSTQGRLGPNEKMEKCMMLTSSNRCRHLPVVEDDQLIGVISIDDIAKAITSDQEIAIHQLEDYIIGGR
jgi:predicted transcriptional regulator